MTEVELGAARSFIGAWFVTDLAVCEALVDYFHARGGGVPGRVGDGVLDPAIKDSRDVALGFEHFEDPPVRQYLEQLREVCQHYVEKFRGSAAVDGWGITEKVNIQHYAPGGGYKSWHCERWGKDLPAAARHLAFMTYLNDVADEGGTEFLYQQVVVRAQKGLTLIWPVDWTHHHRGIVSPTEDKYIITGWFSFT
jgi:hypothetical protein